VSDVDQPLGAVEGGCRSGDGVALEDGQAGGAVEEGRDEAAAYQTVRAGDNTELPSDLLRTVSLG
jgi:hypothetical protein